MPQRGNSCHYPEVTIQLNRNFYFIFYNRSKDQAQRQHCMNLMLPPTGCGATQSPQPALGVGPLQVCVVWIPTQPCPCPGGPVLCPRGLRDPSPTAWVSRAVALQLQMGWDLSTPLYLHCVWNASQVDRSCAHSDSTQLSQYPLYTELEFKSWCPQNHLCLQGSNWGQKAMWVGNAAVCELFSSWILTEFFYLQVP